MKKPAAKSLKETGCRIGIPMAMPRDDAVGRVKGLRGHLPKLKKNRYERNP